MTFYELSQYLQKLEDTSKRLEITSILAELIQSLNENEVSQALYISLGYLEAEFKSVKFNMADKMVIKAVAAAFDKTAEAVEKEYGKTGDLGTVAQDLSIHRKKSDLGILEVYEKMLDIAKDEGSGSQDRKINKTAELLTELSPLSAKYAVRTVLGTTRLGFTELTVVDALVEVLAGKKDKELKKQIEDKYRIHPDIGLIAEKIKEKGISGLDSVEMEVGVPVHAQKAQRLGSPAEAIEKMGEVWGEYKFDGTRVQMHFDKNKKMAIESFDQQDMFAVQKDMTFTKTFTRNLEETTHQYPDLVEAAQKQINADSVILDGEAIGYDKKTGEFLPFQQTIQRKRKHGISETAAEIPLKYMVFDVLYLNGKPLVNEPLAERRKKLTEIIKPGETIVIDENIQTSDSTKVAEFWKESLDKGLEGIMLKKIDSAYEAGARSFSWVKMKKSEDQLLDDSVDCVVLGYYFGRGTRAKFGIGGFLAGIWDEDSGSIKTLTKVGSGLTDDEWVKLKEECDKISTPDSPKNAQIDKKYNCDVWVKPEIIVELTADEISKSSDHSAGYALRFPRLMKLRKDKNLKETTNIAEIEQMYKNQ